MTEVKNLGVSNKVSRQQSTFLKGRWLWTTKQKVKDTNLGTIIFYYNDCFLQMKK